MTQSWEEWVSDLSEHDVRPADDTVLEDLESTKDGNCFILGEVPEGGPHKNESVVAVHAFGLDLEHLTDEKLVEGLAPLNDYEFIYYSTHKHLARAIGEEKRYRVIIPLSEPISPDIYDRLWQSLNLLTKQITDQKTKNIGRVFFSPSTYREGVGEFGHNNTGRMLDPRELLELSKQQEQQEKPSETVEAGAKRIIWALKYMERDNELKGAARAVVAGEPYADAGERHDIGLLLTMYIAQKFSKNPPSADSVAQVFGPSLEAMAKDDPGSPGVDDLLNGYNTAVEKVLVEDCEYQCGSVEPYSSEELQTIAEKQGWTADELEHRWIIQKISSYWFLKDDGTYAGPYSKEEARPAAATILRRAPVRLFTRTKTKYVRRDIGELTEDYGTVAEAAVCDLSIQYSRFDAARGEIVEAPRPIRADLVPTFNPKIDAYFKVMAGENYEKLCNWVACVPDTDKMLCALYLSGVKGTFKTGLATGLARLWHNGPPSDLANILKDFNEDYVAQCPLLLADETIPKTWMNTSVTTKLRSLISTTSRTLNRKFKAPATLRGAIRLILTANHEFLLRSTEVQTPEDIEAIAQRFLFIYVGEESSQWLEQNLSPGEAREWTQGDGFAKHALWLAANRDVQREGRFWVQGSVDQLSFILMGSEFNSLVNYWLVHFLQNPAPVYASSAYTHGLIRILDGDLLVNSQTIIDLWDTYNKNKTNEPTIEKVNTALRAISHRNLVQLRWDGGDKRIRYRKINIDLLTAWSERSVMADAKEIQAALQAEQPDPHKNNGKDNVVSIAEHVARAKVQKEQSE